MATIYHEYTIPEIYQNISNVLKTPIDNLKIDSIEQYLTNY